MNLPTNAQCQKKRLLAYLHQHKAITTLEAREKLDVLHPASRIQELKADGYEITTYRTTEETPLGRHKIARYVLIT